MEISPQPSENVSPRELADLRERLFTIGHSNHEPEDLLALLREAGVTAVADVRSSPYSKRLAHFNRPLLEAFLRRNGIAYVFLGGQLGGRPASPELYHPDGWADYEQMRETPSFREGLQRVVRGLERYTIALMCGEEDPLDCHRALLIAPALKDMGLPPRHIRKGGCVESMAQFEQRLQDETGLGSLFGLAEAYRVMNRKKAFRLAVDADEGF